MGRLNDQQELLAHGLLPLFPWSGLKQELTSSPRPRSQRACTLRFPTTGACTRVRTRSRRLVKADKRKKCQFTRVHKCTPPLSTIHTYTLFCLRILRTIIRIRRGWFKCLVANRQWQNFRSESRWLRKVKDFSYTQPSLPRIVNAPELGIFPPPQGEYEPLTLDTTDRSEVLRCLFPQTLNTSDRSEVKKNHPDLPPWISHIIPRYLYLGTLNFSDSGSLPQLIRGIEGWFV